MEPRPYGFGAMLDADTTEPDSPPAAPPRPGRRSHRSLVEWVVIVVVALVAAFVLRSYIIESYEIPTGSMEPTIVPHDRVLVDKLSYKFGGHPQAGQIVVFHEAPDDTETGTPILIKRVIGLPGQRLRSGPDGEIFVDGKPLKQPWLTKAGFDMGAGPAICAASLSRVDCKGDTLYLPANEYYVMGDHRGDSDDSRYWGPITGKSIIGRAFVRIWPVSRFHWF
jgi:signal peptidase I